MGWTSKHRNPGLPSGYVRLGTIACKILKYLHSKGREGAIHTELMLSLDLPASGVSRTLVVLRRYGYVWVPRTISSYDLQGERTQQVFSVFKPKKVEPFVRKHYRERGAKYRARKKLRVPSIWDFRGQIAVQSIAGEDHV